jgi:hypothetical protein
MTEKKNKPKRNLLYVEMDVPTKERLKKFRREHAMFTRRIISEALNEYFDREENNEKGG